MLAKRNITGLIASACVLALSCEASASVIYAITGVNDLVTFDSATPGSASAPIPIMGLGAGESIVGIDFRPLNGALYGLGSGSGLYTINTATGAATLVGIGLYTLNGTSFGFDFNPVPDRIRVTSDADQNLRLNPNSGALAATDSTLVFNIGDPNQTVDPNIVGSAYTNSFPGATSTTLYGIDSALDILVTQTPPNAGVLNTVGSLGVNTSDAVGFDILAAGNLGFAALTTPGGPSSLYDIDLSTGAATLIGTIGTGLVVRAIAVQQVPEPGSMALLAAGALALFGLGRYRKSS
jgi:hypothetical protein